MKKSSLIIILLIWVLGIISSLLFLFKSGGEKEKTVGNNVKVEFVWTKNDDLGENNVVWSQSGLLLTGDVVFEKEKEIIKTGSITVLMPGFLFDEALRDFVKEMEDDGIIVNFQTIDDIDDYRKTMKAQLDAKNGADLLLIPSDWLDTVDSYSKKLNLWENLISPFFHSVFVQYVDAEKYSFVPYMLDPLVTYISTDVGFSEKELDLENLLSYLNLYDGNKALSIPILWGVGRNDIRFLKMWGESFPGYFTILYNLIYQLDQGNDRAKYQTFLDLTVSDFDYAWDFVNYKLLYKRIMARNKKCEMYPDICIFAYKFADIRFGFISDQEVWNDYFVGGWRKMIDVDIYNFPVGASDYKVRWWWFVSPKYSDNQYIVEKFLQKYIKAGVGWKLELWKHSLSPFVNILTIQKINKKYENIFRYEHNFSLLFAGMDLQEKFLETTDIEEFLMKDVSVDEFLDEFSWKY